MQKQTKLENVMADISPIWAGILKFLNWIGDKKMRRYKYEEWGMKELDQSLSWDERIYTDNDDNLITGVLEGFYGYTTDTSDEKNCQYVENGKRSLKKSSLVKEMHRP